MAICKFKLLVATPCQLVFNCRRFRRACCLSLQGLFFFLIIPADSGSKLLIMSVNIYQVWRHHIPDNWNFMISPSVGTLLFNNAGPMTAVGSDDGAVLNNIW